MRSKHAILAMVLAAAMALLPAVGLAAAGEWTYSGRHNYEVKLEKPDGGTFRPGSTITIEFAMRGASTKGTTVSAYLATDNWGRYATAKRNAIASVNSKNLANGVRTFTINVPTSASTGNYRLWVEVVDRGFNSNEDGPQMFTYLEISGSPVGGTGGQGQSNKNGWSKSGNYWYFYRNGAMVKGWISSGGYWYYTDSNGRMRTGWMKEGNTWYYFDSSGHMKTGWQRSGGSWYYFRSNGAMATGWTKVSGSWYYFNSTGKMATGWLNNGGKYYYFDSSGKMVTGNVTLPDGQKHRFDSSGVWLGNNG